MLYWFIYGLFEIAITHEYISALQQHRRLCTLLLRSPFFITTLLF
jgi:hypothetical protein